MDKDGSPAITTRINDFPFSPSLRGESEGERASAG
jgi:hypothetical protein